MHKPFSSKTIIMGLIQRMAWSIRWSPNSSFLCQETSYQKRANELKQCTKNPTQVKASPNHYLLSSLTRRRQTQPHPLLQTTRRRRKTQFLDLPRLRSRASMGLAFSINNEMSPSNFCGGAQPSPLRLCWLLRLTSPLLWTKLHLRPHLLEYVPLLFFDEL